MDDQIDSGQLTDDTCERSLSPSEDTPAVKRSKVRKINAKTKPSTSFLDTADVDFVFDVDGNEEVVPAHKFMLAFHSPVFRQMFYGELKEKGDIKLTDTTVDAFVDLMRCMYNFKLTIEGSPLELSPLLALAHKYDVNWLERECQRILIEIINENVVAILWVLPLANLYSYDELRQKCIDKIHAHGNSIIDSPEFVDCEKELMKEIFGIDFMDRNEQKVFETCIKWAKRACEKSGFDPELPENIRKQLGDNFNLIQFESMSRKQFLQCLSINPTTFTSHEIQKFASHLCKAKSNKVQSQSILAIETSSYKVSLTESSKYKIIARLATPELSPQRLLEDQSTADVFFVFKNDDNEVIERIPAHKYILASKSKNFADRFKVITNSDEEITITGVSAEVFMYFLRLIYVRFKEQYFAILKEVGDHHIDALLSLNREYFGESLSYRNNLYIDHLINSLNDQNVIRLFELSWKHSLDELKTKCVDLMKEKGEQLITSDVFMDCSQENLKSILEHRIWDGENLLATTCIKWAKKYYELDSGEDPKNIRMVMGDLFELIPFASMDLTEFIDFQSEYRGMLTADEVLKLINEFSDRRNPRSTDIINID